MNEYIIKGGKLLHGEVRVHGAKNSVLPILAAALLYKGETVLHNCPDLSDVNSAINILKHLGCKVKRENTTIIIDSTDIIRDDVPENLMREMRSSVIFLGAIIARQGSAYMFTPGGCELGPRPIDMHIESLRQLGIEIEEESGNLRCKADKLCGKDIYLRFPSVGATENVMIAATACEGTTRIFNAACEPEIEDLQNFLNKMGCIVKGAGSSCIEIEGCKASRSAEHSVIPDRIVAGTYMCAVAATGGKIRITGVCPPHFYTLTGVLRDAGCEIEAGESELTIEKKLPRLKAVSEIVTMPYPGFATDIQSPLMAALSTADGASMFVENIFQNRYRQVDELRRMGADITVNGRVAVIRGVHKLHGAKVCATDLRGGAALVVAALGADGVSEICDIKHIERGYESFAERLREIGADIVR